MLMLFLILLVLLITLVATDESKPDRMDTDPANPHDSAP
jgi:hypothetical protein